MTKSVRLLLMGAALTGFVAGQNAFAQDTDKKDDTKKADSGKKADQEPRKKSMPAKARTPAKARAAAVRPKARMIAKAKANADRRQAHAKERDRSSYGSSQLRGPVDRRWSSILIFRPRSLYQDLCPQIDSTDTRTSA